MFSKEELEKAMIEGAREEGEARGQIKGKVAAFLEIGQTEEEIAKRIGLAIEEVKRIITELKAKDTIVV